MKYKECRKYHENNKYIFQYYSAGVIICITKLFYFSLTASSLFRTSLTAPASGLTLIG